MRRFPGVVLELRTARANGVPHSLIRRGGPPKWRPKDRMLALALTAYEDSLCSGCGQPRDRAWNDDMADLYQSHTALCRGCEVLNGDETAKRPRHEHAWLTDDAPAGFVPDPRMLSVD